MPGVVVVTRQMPWDGLSWGRWTLEPPGRDTALKSANGSNEHTRNTQVRGPREEVKPLLLPVSLSIYLSWNGAYKVFLSLVLRKKNQPIDVSGVVSLDVVFSL